MIVTAELPLVSIGMPVYNAERYIRPAMDSLLAQDYPNLEIIISDNASTDTTEQICKEYAERNCSIAYHRAEKNLGAIWNFNNAFGPRKGKDLLVAAFDDIRDPRYVSRCVFALESHPDAVLCCTNLNFIDETGQQVESSRRAYGIRPTHRTRLGRLRQVAQGEVWFDVYDLAKRAELAKVRRQVPTWGFDVVVVL